MNRSIKFYSTLSRQVEDFRPITEGEIRLYACGVTTYDEAHLGHGRQAVFFDVLRRYLEYCGYRVTYVRNYTDIDDKIITRAREAGSDPLELSEYYIQKTAQDLSRLKVTSATYEPKVSDHIEDIINLIAELIESGVAYVVDGEVLFEVSKFPTYGRLSRLKAEELINDDGADYKKHPQDFSLWKKAKAGEPAWPSPWGNGRPGWHIECSALVRRYLGDRIDIHGGGVDLIFPHHENEIAQSESLTGNRLANYWLHNGLVTIDGKKMSKSLGNFITIDQALSSYQPDVIRLAVLSSHFSSPLDFSQELFETVRKRVYYFYKTLSTVEELLHNSRPPAEGQDLLKETTAKMTTGFEAAMSDNLNLPVVLSELSATFQAVNKFLSDFEVSEADRAVSLNSFREEFRKLAAVIHVLDEEPAEYIKQEKDRYLTAQNLSEQVINQMIWRRTEAKAKEDFTLSDQLRDELKAQGIQLHDTADGTGWDIDY